MAAVRDSGAADPDRGGSIAAQAGQAARGCWRSNMIGTWLAISAIVLASFACAALLLRLPREGFAIRSEEHTSELQSLMRISYAVFCLKKKKTKEIDIIH